MEKSGKLGGLGLLNRPNREHRGNTITISTALPHELNQVIITARSHISKILSFGAVFVIMGNETCDLDSAVSALAFGLYSYDTAFEEDDSTVIPIFNIPKRDLPLKTEVNYFLKKYKIEVNNIICRDEIDLKALHEKGNLRLVLVDHHVLQGEDVDMQSSVVTVIDHRPEDPNWKWRNIEDVTIKTVGSCATLVADRLLQSKIHIVTQTTANLLLGTILLDTNCLRERATNLDNAVVNQLNAILRDKFKNPVDNQRMCSDLQKAKADVSSLTSAQILLKDVKTTTGGIPIIGLPIKVKEFLERPDAVSALNDFCSQHNTQVCVLYGVRILSEMVTRDLAVYTPSNDEDAEKIAKVLRESHNPDLRLEEPDTPVNVDGCTLYEQRNIRATRKQILPLVQQFKEMS